LAPSQFIDCLTEFLGNIIGVRARDETGRVGFASMPG